MSKPVIAVRRREAALAKFSFKIEKIKELLAGGDIQRIPSKMRPTTFVEWEDQELGVQKISRNSLYETDKEYTSLHIEMHAILARIVNVRTGNNKKEKVTEKLQDKINVLEARIQNYVNDYSEAKSELLKKDKEIARLRTQLIRARENEGKIKHLRSVMKSPE
jgi:chromosome segregation ATPase